MLIKPLFESRGVLFLVCCLIRYFCVKNGTENLSELAWLHMCSSVL